MVLVLRYVPARLGKEVHGVCADERHCYALRR
jgi:hypothetical protein